MENTCKCRACGRRFKPDSHNRDRQGYCSRPDCQRQRRTLRQRQRRQSAASRSNPARTLTKSRGLQPASRLSEADIRNENPAIIGLISMVTGITHLEELQRVYRQLWLRGVEIVAAGNEQTLQNPAVISLLQKKTDPKRSMG